MALADIIASIKAQAKNDISNINEQTEVEKASITHKTNDEISALESDIKKQTEAKKTQMQKKAQTMVEMNHRKKLLEEKRKSLDSVYDEVLEEVNKRPKDKLKKFEDSLKSKLKGMVRDTKESKEGGFVFVSKNSEEDFTFPHLVNSVLRPMTELEVSSKLFA